MRQPSLRVFATGLVLVLLLTAASCGGGGGSGGMVAGAGAGTTTGGGTTGGGTTGGGTTPPPPPPTQVGPLARKAAQLEAAFQSEHVFEGLHFNVHKDPQGQVVALGSTADACIWTGQYVAAEAERFRATGDSDALGNMERSLQALHILQDINGVPGYVSRNFGRPPLITGEPATGQYAGLEYRVRGTVSRDQYTGWMIGVGRAHDLITDPVLKGALEDDCRAIADHLMANDLALIVPRNGVDETHFSLDPGQLVTGPITAQDWAQIDDFPANLLVQAIPYDPQIADALINARFPPIKAGEALRALFFFKTMAVVTGDQRIHDYYHNELIGNRDFLRVITDYGTILDDVLQGRNTQVVVDIFQGVGRVITDVLAAYVRSRTGFLGPIAGPLAAQLLQPIVDQITRAIGGVIADAIQWITNPANLNAANQTVQGINMLGTILSAVGLTSAGQQLQSFTGPIAPYLASDLDTARRTMMSGVGENLTFTSLYGLCELETDPAIKAVYQDLLQRKLEGRRGEHNTYFTFVHGAHASTGPDVAEMPLAIQALHDHYGATDRAERLVDNSGHPGLVVSPWPDRFGRTGNVATTAFPLALRAPNHYHWQENPYAIVSGSPNGEIQSGLSYLVAYWLGRRAGLVDPAW